MQTHFIVFLVCLLAFYSENQTHFGKQNISETNEDIWTNNTNTCDCEVTAKHNLTRRQTVVLVLSLKRYFHASCVLVGCSNEHTSRAIELAKDLSENGAMASVVDVMDLNVIASSFLCSRNRPLFVMFADKATQLSLEGMQKVASYPRWLLLLASHEHVDFLKNINVPFDCEFLVTENLSADEVQITEVYRVTEYMDLNEGYFGTWELAEGLNGPKIPLYGRRASLQGQVIHGATLTGVPNGAQPVKAHGIFGAVWRLLEKRVNFTTVLRRPRDTSYGHQAENGTWHGVVGMVWDGRASVAVDDIAMNKYRVEAVDFLMPILRSPVCIYIRKPLSRVVEWNNFSPLGKRIWVGVVASALGAGIVLVVAHRSHTLHKMVERRRANGPFSSVPGAVFHVVGLFCQQGISDPVRDCSSRIVLIFAGAASVVLLSAYSGALTSLLALSKPDLPFKTMQEFVDDGTYSLSSSKKSYQGYFDEDENNPVIRQLHEQFVKPFVDTFPPNSEVGLTRVCREERYAWVTSGMYRYSDVFVKEHFRCKIVPVPECLREHTISMVISKGSAFKGIINHNLHYLRDSGILRRIKVAFLSDRLTETTSRLPEVTLNKVLAIGVVLGTGMALSVLVLVLENLHSVYTAKKKLN